MKKDITFIKRKDIPQPYRNIMVRQVELFKFKKSFELSYMQKQSFENEHILTGQWSSLDYLVLTKCYDFAGPDIFSGKNLKECYTNVLHIQNYFRHLLT